MDMEIIRINALKAREFGARVEIVGLWVWAYFDSKPAKEVRQALKDMRFHWNKVRGCWQFAGVPCSKSPADSFSIKAKYGVQEIMDDTLAVAS